VRAVDPTVCAPPVHVRLKSGFPLEAFSTWSFPHSPFLSICLRFDKNKKDKIYDKKILNTKLAQEKFHTKSLEIKKKVCVKTFLKN
jgi:hypothetical protein